jgi:phosphatidylserine decarboxylase
MARTRSSPIAIEGLPFILPLGIATAVAVWRGWFYAGVCLSVLTAFAVYFFRNPRRAIPPSDRLVLSPADGRVVQVGECLEERFFQQGTTKVSIFMSLFDVHINRSPISGVVEEKSYTPGKFYSANKDRSLSRLPVLSREELSVTRTGATGLRKGRFWA